MFSKYQHILRMSDPEVEGITNGTVYVFPKIDGSNCCLWYEEGEVHGGSRNREVSLEKDNEKFFKTVSNDSSYLEFFKQHPELRLFGEWLTPHTIKNYDSSAWNKFYIFDVAVDEEGPNNAKLRYLSYEEYQPLLEEAGLRYLNPLATLENPTEEELKELMNNNKFLMKDGFVGEGIVLKNYAFRDKINHQRFAKMIAGEFKKKQVVLGQPVEVQIVQDFVTEDFVMKEYEKLRISGVSSIQKALLGKVFYEMIDEEMSHILKKYHLPKIDFRTLSNLTADKVKEVLPELFNNK